MYRVFDEESGIEYIMIPWHTDYRKSTDPYIVYEWIKFGE